MKLTRTPKGTPTKAIFETFLQVPLGKIKSFKSTKTRQSLVFRMRNNQVEQTSQDYATSQDVIAYRGFYKVQLKASLVQCSRYSARRDKSYTKSRRSSKFKQLTFQTSSKIEKLLVYYTWCSITRYRCLWSVAYNPKLAEQTYRSEGFIKI